MILLILYLERSARPPPLQLKGRTSGRREEGKGNKLIQNWDKLRTELGQNSALPEDGRQRKSCQNFSLEGSQGTQNSPREPPRAALGTENQQFSPKSARKGRKRDAGARKSAEIRPKGHTLGTGWEPKSAQNQARDRKRTPPDAARRTFRDFRCPSASKVAFFVDV